MLAYNYQPQDYFFFILNLVIITGYMIAALTLLFSTKIMPVLSVLFRTRTRLAGAIFFVFSAVTRWELAWHVIIQKPYLNLTNQKSVPWGVNLPHLILATIVLVFLTLAFYDLTGKRD